MRECNLVPVEMLPKRGWWARFRERREGTHVTGIAIDSDAIRAACVERGRDGTARVAHVAAVPLPAGAIGDGDDPFTVHDAVAVAGALHTLHGQLAAAGWPGDARTVVGVAGPTVIAKTVLVPRMSDAECDAQLSFEAEQYLSWNVHDAVLGWEAAGADAGVSRRERVIVLSAMQRGMFAGFSRLFADAGFAVDAIEPNALALRRYLRATRDPAAEPSTTPTAIMHIGVSYTSVVITNGHQLAFTRDFHIGTAYIAEEAARDPAPASVYMVETFATVGMRFPLGTEGRAAVDVHVGEIKRSMDFYRACERDPEIDHVLLCGPGAWIPEFSRTEVADRLECPIRVAMPTSELAFPASATVVGSDVVLAIGLALRNDWAHVRERRKWAKARAPLARVHERKPSPPPLVHFPHGRTAHPRASAEHHRLYVPSDRVLARAFEALAFLLAEGAYLDAALGAIADDPRVGPRRFRAAIARVRAAIADDGAGFARAFATHVACPPVVLLAIARAEKSRTLGNTLRVCSRYLRTGSEIPFLDDASAACVRASR